MARLKLLQNQITLTYLDVFSVTLESAVAPD